MEKPARRCVVNKLPAELFHEIFSYFDSPSYIEQHLQDDPASLFDKDGRRRPISDPLDREKYSPDAPFKTFSLVCWTWRQQVRPRLFQHLHFRLQHEIDKFSRPKAPLLEAFEEYIRKDRKLFASVVQSLTIVIVPPSRSGDSFLARLEKPITEIADIAIADPKRVGQLVSTACGHFSMWRTVQALWNVLKDVLPARLTFFGTGPALQTVLQDSSFYNAGDDAMWSARMRLLSLSCEKKPNSENPNLLHSPSNCHYSFGDLFNMYQWNTILVNEGTPFSEKQPGKLCDSLQALLKSLDRKNKQPQCESFKSLICVSEYIRPSRIKNYAVLVPLFPNLERFHFRRLPANFNPHGAFKMKPWYVLPTLCVPAEEQFQARKVEFKAQDLKNIACLNTRMCKVYEFPDLALQPQKWYPLAEKINGARGSRLRAEKPGKFVRRGPAELDKK